jgi:hypothetical protein
MRVFALVSNTTAVFVCTFVGLSVGGLLGAMVLGLAGANAGLTIFWIIQLMRARS